MLRTLNSPGKGSDICHSEERMTTLQNRRAYITRKLTKRLIERVIRMPGAITETKSTPWTVAEQFVEERIKLKQGNSRVALALRNAKIHRPSLYLSAKKSFDRALGRDEINRTADKKVPKKKTNSRDDKTQRSPQTERKSRRNTPS